MADDDARRWKAMFDGVQQELTKTKRHLAQAARSLAALRRENDALKLQLRQFRGGINNQMGRPSFTFAEKYVSDGHNDDAKFVPPQAPDADAEDEDDFLGSMIYNSIRAEKARVEADRVESLSPEDHALPLRTNDEVVHTSGGRDNPATKIISPTVSPAGQAGEDEDKADSHAHLLLNLQHEIVDNPAPIIARNASKTSRVQVLEERTTPTLPKSSTPQCKDKNAPHHKLNSGGDFPKDAIPPGILNQTSVIPHRPMINNQSSTRVGTATVGGMTAASGRVHLSTIKRHFKEGSEPQKISYKKFRMPGCDKRLSQGYIHMDLHKGGNIDRAQNGGVCQGGNEIEHGPKLLRKQEGCIKLARGGDAGEDHRRKDDMMPGLRKDQEGKDSTDTSHKSSMCSTDGRKWGNVDESHGTAAPSPHFRPHPIAKTLLDTKDSALRFPFKLYAMLESVAYSGDSSAASWSSSGQSLIIHDEVAFMENLVPRHFKLGKFRSFTRQLNLWGFRSVSENTWFHEHFARGNIDGLKFVRRRTDDPKRRARPEKRRGERKGHSTDREQHTSMASRPQGVNFLDQP